MMYSLIDHYVEGLFENVPYSRASAQGRSRVQERLRAQYDIEKKVSREGAFQRVVAACPTLASAAALAGYTGEEVAAWLSDQDIAGEDQVRRAFRFTRRRLYTVLILSALAVRLLLSGVTEGIWTYYALSAVLLLFAALAFKKRGPAPDMRLSMEAVQCLQALGDKYVKKTFNTLFLSVVAATCFALTSVQLGSNSKDVEMLRYLAANSGFMLAFAVLFIKNHALAAWVHRLLGTPVSQRQLSRGFLIGAAALSLVYWGAVTAMLVLFNVLNLFAFFAAAGLYAALALLLNLTLRKKLTFQNLRMNRLKVALVGGAAVLAAGYWFLSRDVWITQRYINTVPNVSVTDAAIDYDDATGVYTITNRKDTFRILQLTDIHLGGSLSSYTNDMSALKTVFDLIDYARPDLVVVTGDLTYPVGIFSFSLNNSAPVMQFAAFMRNTGVPWAFTYGNHDTEAMARTDKYSLNELYKSLSYKTSKNLLYPYVQPPVTGRNNQLIEVRNADGTLNTALFLIDSNAYIGKGFSRYDFIRDDQVDWYKENVEVLCEREGRLVPSLVFFHIPLQEYRTAYQLYQSGSDEVTWYFGSNDEGKICCSEYPSRLFDTAAALGSTRGFFCGHDHYNNMSLEYRGMRLTYGMSIDYLVEPGIAHKDKQRGATLIELDSEGQMALSQIPYSSIPKQAD